MDTKPHNHTESAHGSNYVPTPEEVAIGYELRDTHLKPIIIFALALSITVAATFFVVIGVQNGLESLAKREENQKSLPHPMSTDEARLPKAMVPPGPLLEPSRGNTNLPQQDLAEVKEHADGILKSYKDLGNGFVRIPLDTAMDMVVTTSLPLTLPTTQPSAGPTMPPASAMHGPGGVP